MGVELMSDEDVECEWGGVSRLDTKAPLACNVPIIGFVAYTSLPVEPHNPLSLTTISFYASLPQISEWWDSRIVGKPSHRDVRIVTEPKIMWGNKGTVVFMISEWWDSRIVGKPSHRDVRIVTEPKIMWGNKGTVVFMDFVAYTSLPAEPHNPLSLTTISFYASLPQISEWWDSLIVGKPSHRDVRIVTEPKIMWGNKGTVVFMAVSRNGALLWNAKGPLILINGVRNSDETKTSSVSRLDTKAPLACNVPIIGFVAYTSLPVEPHNPLSLTTISFYASLPQISEWWDSLIVGKPSHRDVRNVTEPKIMCGNKGTVVFMAVSSNGGAIWNAKGPLILINGVRNSDETKTSSVSRLDTKAPLACNVPIIGFAAYTSLPVEPHNSLSLTTISFYASLPQISEWWDSLIVGKPSHRDVRNVTEPKIMCGNKGTVVFMVSPMLSVGII
ncbi:hypothetical protein CDAR_454571 [Caerostris darwini]|uniref:Uncharacterized protein n=1 Tax=Caerostris darwini TaxID=1538125 RepID=A0AAV4TUY7_9ARAC|nr:hypothetical protein CDAR_454571 [Caerostris darwini]